MSTPSIINLISQNRIELMGVATIAVFFLHILVIADIQNRFYRDLIGISVNWMFTEGFLFLSGFGIYYSLNKCNNIFSFYKKRIRRLYFPFLIIAGPFLILLSLCQGTSIWMLFARLSTINFWIEGNYCAMWYVSVTLVLYLLSPVFYKLMKGKIGFGCWVVLFLGLLVFLDYVKNVVLSENEFLHYQWITQTPAFLLGMLVAKLESYEQNGISALLLIAILLEPIAIFTLNRCHRFLFFPHILNHLNYIVYFSFLFDYLKRSPNFVGGGIMLDGARFLGKHSLELYMLHMLIYNSIKYFSNICLTTNILLSIIISLIICKPVKKGTEKIIVLICNKK